MPIADCDEVFNYWEPLHYLLHGHGLQTWEYSPAYALRSYLYVVLHLPFALLARAAAQSFGGDKVTAFYLTRAALGLASTGCELRLVTSTHAALGPSVALPTLILLASSAGMSHASISFLPSSFAMGCLSLAIAHWIDASRLVAAALPTRPTSPSPSARAYALAIWWVAAASLVGWPFAALAGLPLAIDATAALGPRRFLSLAVRYGILLAVPTLALDSYFYGRLTLSPLNMLRYNLNLSGGAQLYGTEPAAFYLKNLLLNLGLGLPAALATPLLLAAAGLAAHFRQRRTKRSGDYVPSFPVQSSAPQPSLPSAHHSTHPQPAATASPLLSRRRVLLLLSPGYIWVAFFSAIPHKEERFLYPVYSVLCLAAAVAVDQASRLCAAAVQGTAAPGGAGGRIGHGNAKTAVGKGGAGGASTGLQGDQSFHRAVRLCRATLLFTAAAIGISRSAALCVYYGAPALTYARLSRHIAAGQRSGAAPGPSATGRPSASTAPSLSAPVNVCVGAEWYRFPSSFFLPSPSVSVRFVNSGGGGLLPSPFSALPPAGSRAVHAHFNDRNEAAEASFTPEHLCEYMIVLNLDAEPERGAGLEGGKRQAGGGSAAGLAGRWAEWASAIPFLDAGRSRGWSRAFFVPALELPGEGGVAAATFLRRHNVFGQYVVLERG
jgi:alpha-1,2-mannosyltransferase